MDVDDSIDVSRQDTVPSAVEGQHQDAEPPLKLTKKQFILNELKELLAIILYLAASISILQTYKSMVLLQLGVNEFAHNYIVAIVEAVLLGKVVAIAQKLRFLKAFSDRPLIWAVLYRSLVMTIIVDLGERGEDHLFPRTAHLIARSGNPMALFITHQFASMVIFIVLFAARGLEEKFGRGTMWKLFFEAPAAKSERPE